MSAALGQRSVKLLEHDPDLGDRLPSERRDEARRHVVAQTIALSRGELTAAALDRSRRSLHGLLLLDGLVSRGAWLRETTTVELFGAGDLLEPATDTVDGRLVPVGVSWTVLEPARAAVIDDAFVHATRRWPELLVALFDRVVAQSTRLATHCAIAQLPRIEDRVETLLWFLAERWGRIGAHGVVLPLRLTHEVLGQMLGARRPTVSLALRALEEAGTVHRRADGAWLLHRERQDAPVPVGLPGGGVRFVVTPATPVCLRRAAAGARR